MRELEAALSRGRLRPGSRDPFQLLVATILSAQCTDARVNMVTPGLFRRFPDARPASRPPTRRSWRTLIRSTGFFRAKAGTSRRWPRGWPSSTAGRSPRPRALTALAGVGRKTANVVLGTAFGIASGVVVDTHVKRLAYRLGLTTRKRPGADRARPDGRRPADPNGSTSATG